MSEMGAIIAETLGRMVDMDAARAANAALERGERPSIWDAFNELGLARMLLPEAEGGADCGWRDLGEVTQALAHSGAPSFLPEEAAARGLCRFFGLPQPEEAVTLASPGFALMLDGNTASGTLPGVPWGRLSPWVLAEAAGRPVLIDVRKADWRLDRNLAHEPRDDATVEGAPAIAGVVHPGAAALIEMTGALIRSGQMAGAAARAAELTVVYASERRQFDKPIAAFQAIQQQLALMTEESLAAGISARCAFAAFDGPEADAWVAAAKSRTGDAAVAVAAIAHQVHGAIGFTMEHHLRFFTQRLTAWRHEFGGAAAWAERLGASVMSDDREPWDRIVRIGDTVA